jgi:hypothetical protein
MFLIGAGSAKADRVAPPPDIAVPATAAPLTKTETADAVTEPLRTEVVFCIDCSGSMGQSLARAQQAIAYLIREMQARTPEAPIRVGIIRYGTGSSALEVCPLTSDPSTISRYLSRLEISGGAEFVGTFIQYGVERMKWTDRENVDRKIIMVGNETAFQGPVDFRQAATIAYQRGFTVSAIYCPTISDEQQADIARATATTRVLIKGVPQRSIINKREMLSVENTWILTAYFGGGEVMKLSADPRRPLLRYSAEEVGKLVEEIIPQQEEQMAQADAAFLGLDMTGQYGGVVRRTVPRGPIRR